MLGFIGSLQGRSKTGYKALEPSLDNGVQEMYGMICKGCVTGWSVSVT